MAPGPPLNTITKKSLLPKGDPGAHITRSAKHVLFNRREEIHKPPCDKAGQTTKLFEANKVCLAALRLPRGAADFIFMAMIFCLRILDYEFGWNALCWTRSQLKIYLAKFLSSWLNWLHVQVFLKMNSPGTTITNVIARHKFNILEMDRFCALTSRMQNINQTFRRMANNFTNCTSWWRLSTKSITLIFAGTKHIVLSYCNRIISVSSPTKYPQNPIHQKLFLKNQQKNRHKIQLTKIKPIFTNI